MSDWIWTYRDYVPEREGLRETLCTLGNGYFATRGAASEASADGVHYPGCYVAGGYNRLQSKIHDHVVENEDLVNLPNWLPLNLRPAGGAWLDVDACDILDYEQRLDLRHGVLLRVLTVRDGEGRDTRFEQERMVHMRRSHLAALQVRATALNWDGRLQIASALDGRVVNAGVARYGALAKQHLEPVAAQAVGADGMLLHCRTSQSRLEIALGARTRLYRDGHRVEAEPEITRAAGYVSLRFEVPVRRNEPLAVEKIASLYTSRDPAISETVLAARSAAAAAPAWATLRSEHDTVWEQLWERFDMQLKLDEGAGSATLRILRLHILHLLQTVSLNTIDLDAGVPARGLHGEAYRGHIFWDELFIFPLLNLRLPEITRELLMYRYRRLDEARAGARAAGHAGAMYPWQSGSDGREETQKLHLNPQSGRWLADNTHLQRHVNAAIAYNVWQYYQVTLDTEFLSFYGAEMILEIARFWASMARYDPELDRYEITGVTGPDEFQTGYPDREEPGLDNHAYTNVMAAWVLQTAAGLRDHLPGRRWSELTALLGVSEDDAAHWDAVSRKLRVCFHDDGIISQFEGYDALEELDWERLRAQYGDIQRLDRILEAENDSSDRYKASKQADVLMLFYLFSADELGALFERMGYAFDEAMLARNIDYYLARTSHGSTLSRVVHASVLARRDPAGSWRHFREALQSDVGDIQGGTTAEGIHLGAMAGTVDLVQRVYTGIEVRHGALHLNPALPDALRRLSLRLRYRGYALNLEVTHEQLKIDVIEGNHFPITLAVGTHSETVHGGEKLRFDLTS